MDADTIYLELSSLTIFDVRQLEDTLQSSLNNKQCISINLTLIDELDAAGAQWLFSLEQRGLLQANTIKLSQPNDFCMEQLGLMGLKRLVGGGENGSD